MGKAKYSGSAASGGAASGYFVAMIGAAWYWVSQADGFWPVIVALLKALVWPGFFVYDVLKFIGN
jgi:hypothetical protein